LIVKVLEKIRATLNRQLNKKEAGNDWTAWVGPVTLAVFAFGLCGLIWVLVDATTSPDLVLAALEQLEASAEAIVTPYTTASEVQGAVLEKAWELTWLDPGQPPSNPIPGSPVCWHVSKLDVMVNGSSVQVWRCESSGIITWDFVFAEAELQWP